MKKILKTVMALIGIVTIQSCSTGFDTQQLVNDLVFNAVEELNLKYKEVVVDTFDNSISCKIQDEGTFTVWYSDAAMTTPEIVRLKGFNLDAELFYNDLGWDMPELNWEQSIGKMTVTDLYGINEAVYNKQTEILNIKISNPSPGSFGKRRK